jgi:large subunit ribosomal protein L34
MAMHYPRRVSKIKRARMFGFRARMKTKAGRKMINRKRALGRRITPEM